MVCQALAHTDGQVPNLEVWYFNQKFNVLLDILKLHHIGSLKSAMIGLFFFFRDSVYQYIPASVLLITAWHPGPVGTNCQWPEARFQFYISQSRLTAETHIPI